MKKPLTIYEDFVAGIDEAGRGPLAGPVVAAAVILPPGLDIPGVNDSKKLSATKRNALAMEIKQKATAYAYGIVNVNTIEKINILQSTMYAMTIAARGLKPCPSKLLIDGNRLPENLPKHLATRAQAIIQGDQTQLVIAAASILAKVKRDEIMIALHNMYPQYGFAQHKGYGTKTHREAIKAHGLCPHHRESFCSRIFM